MTGKNVLKKAENSNKNIIFAAIYARTSSPNQKFNYSIKEQVNQCWEYCNKRNWIVRYVFVDECQSGKDVERIKFKMMLEKAEKKEFNVIVFWKLDRFCRSLVDLVNVERMLRKWEVGLCSVTEFIDTTTPVGRFNFRNLASVAELEREIIGERARLGLYALAREHKWPNLHLPLGYDKDENGRLAVNPAEAALVRRIFKMYLNVGSMAEVAFQLNKENIQTKKGNKWNARAIRDVLTNEIYIGNYSVAGVSEHIEEYRIIDDQTFLKASKLRLRFGGHKAKKSHMPSERKKETVERLIERYKEALKRFKVIDFTMES